MSEIINKVAQSSLVTLDLEELYQERENVVYDLKDNLFQGLILKEKDFREFIKSHDWSVYQDKNIAIFCSADAIIPTWAYMLLTVTLAPYAQHITYGTIEDLRKEVFLKLVNNLDVEPFKDKKVVVKGCSKIQVPTATYVALTHRLQPIVSSLMFGEPCSTVPLYKAKKSK